MTKMTLADLAVILTECAGADDPLRLDERGADEEFADLGYDSLALLEAAAVAGRRFGVTLPDDEIVGAQTPRQFLDRVNRAIAVNQSTQV